MDELAGRIERALRPQGTRERAVKEKAYLRSELVHLGVTVPRMRATVVKLAREVRAELTHDALVAAALALWQRGVFELRAAAIELLIRRVDLLGVADVPLIERLIRESRTWALVDALAPSVMGALLAAHPQLGRVLDQWAADADFWVRRAALLTLLPALRRGAGDSARDFERDFERFGRYADAMLEEEEFFIRKAIGWVLRETSKRDPARVHAWLAPRAHRASGVTLREAVKYLPARQRDALVKATRGAARSRRPPATRPRPPGGSV